MTAAPVPAARQRECRYVVRLRMRTHAWTSPGMTQIDAEKLRVDLRGQLVDIGDAYGFIEFAGRDGKHFDVRGREVMAVEVSPEGQYEPKDGRHQPAAATSHGVGAVGGGSLTVQVHGDVPETGTAWLQQRSAVRHVPLDRQDQR